MVQASHAAQLAGAAWPVAVGQRLVLLSAMDERDLLAAREHCAALGIGTVLFHEPDPAAPGEGPMGHTALCTEPLRASERRRLRKYRLWAPQG